MHFKQKTINQTTEGIVYCDNHFFYHLENF